MNLEINSWRPASSDIPASPGVYRFSNKKGQIIYVGKATNLRSRISSYFANPNSLHPRTKALMEEATEVNWTILKNDSEALVYECSQIKEFDPKFNVRFRDDKSYPSISISISEPFPRLSIVREKLRPGSKYFGPYAHVWAVRRTVDDLLKVFPMRSCNKTVFERALRTNRPCLLAFIAKCAAPCVGHVTQGEHMEIANELISFLSGKQDKFLKQLKSAMIELSQQEEYEAAGKIRDQLAALEKVIESNALAFSDSTDADLIAIAGDDYELGVQIFHVSQGRITGQRALTIERIEDLSLSGYMLRVLQRIYIESSDVNPPKEILVSHLPEAVESLVTALRMERGISSKFHVPIRGDKKSLMDLAVINAGENLLRHRSRRVNDLNARTESLRQLQLDANLPSAPLRIACIDISNLHFTDTVGSLVVFEDGLPKRKDYRKFSIKDVSGGDPGAIAEVVRRYFQAGPPHLDLLLIDGGLPQVNSAAAVLSTLDLKTPILGLAKRLEEVWFPNAPAPIILPRNSDSLFLLQRIRDEAHRFAIQFHRARRKGTTISSQINDIPGVGAKRMQLILQKFGSLKNLSEATPEQLTEIPGIGEKLANEIVEYLSGGQSRDQ